MRQKFKTTLRDVVFPYFLIFLGTTVLPTLLINVPFINIPLILLCWPLWEMRPELTATQYGHVEWLFFGTILRSPWAWFCVSSYFTALTLPIYLFTGLIQKLLTRFTSSLAEGKLKGSVQIAGTNVGEDNATLSIKLPKRFVALLVDVAVVKFMIFFLTEAALQIIGMSIYDEVKILRETYRLECFLLVGCVYSLSFECSKYAGTLGKMLFGYTIVRLDEKKLDPITALIRYLSKVITFVFLLGIPLLWVFFDEHNRPLHERVSRTTTRSQRSM